MTVAGIVAIPGVRHRILVTLLVIVVVRFGVVLPVPTFGVLELVVAPPVGDETFWERLARIFQLTESGVLALGIVPYGAALVLYQSIGERFACGRPGHIRVELYRYEGLLA